MRKGKQGTGLSGNPISIHDNESKGTDVIQKGRKTGPNIGMEGEDKTSGNHKSEEREVSKEREVPRAHLAYPVPNPLVDWEKDEKGTVTLIYRKNFGRFEKWLHSKIGGPENIRRPLDEPGSRMWTLFDGKHTIAEICLIVDREFKEEMSPVLRKVRHFLEQLLILNLIILKSAEEIEEEKSKGETKGVQGDGEPEEEEEEEGA